MISYRHADILKKIAPTKMLIRFELKGGAVVLKWLGPVDEKYTEDTWMRIKYLKRSLINLLLGIPSNHGIDRDTSTNDVVFRLVHNHVIDALKNDPRVLSVRPLLFSVPEVEIEVVIR